MITVTNTITHCHTEIKYITYMPVFNKKKTAFSQIGIFAACVKKKTKIYKSVLLSYISVIRLYVCFMCKMYMYNNDGGVLITSIPLTVMVSLHPDVLSGSSRGFVITLVIRASRH